MSWGIVVESEENIDRWVDVVSTGLNIFMLIPFSDGGGRLIGKTKDPARLAVHNRLAIAFDY